LIFLTIIFTYHEQTQVGFMVGSQPGG